LNHLAEAVDAHDVVGFYDLIGVGHFEQAQ
jgi:hypothetical protein